MEDQSRTRSDDRILVTKPIEGLTAKSTTGLLDKRLFTGEANLHAVKDIQYNLWGLKYEHSKLPQALRQKFTKFNDLLDHTKRYLSTRNLQIVEVKD